MAIVSNAAAVNPRYRHRSRVNVAVMSLSLLATGIGLFFLAAILLTLLVHGVGALSISMFTETTPAPQSEGGLANAIWGSIRMTFVGMILGTPIGVLAGTYLAEYSRGTRLGNLIQFINDVLLSAPSIIIGLFVYQVVVINQRHFSGWAGGMALAILVIPVVTRTSVDMLNLVPNGLREAAAALGTPKWRIVTQICYRAALQGMVTGVLLAFARISGETAPLLFTALNNQFGSDMHQAVASLPVVIFQFALSPYENWKTLAWGGALLIAIVILALNILARYLSSLGRSKQ